MKRKRSPTIGGRCPKCRRGKVLEWRVGLYCSRRYAATNPCRWEA